MQYLSQRKFCKADQEDSYFNDDKDENTGLLPLALLVKQSTPTPVLDMAKLMEDVNCLDLSSRGRPCQSEQNTTYKEFIYRKIQMELTP